MIDIETKKLFVKWSFTGGGGLREVVAMRELTVVGGAGFPGEVGGLAPYGVPPFILAVFLPCRLPQFFLVVVVVFLFVGSFCSLCFHGLEASHRVPWTSKIRKKKHEFLPVTDRRLCHADEPK